MPKKIDPAPAYDANASTVPLQGEVLPPGPPSQPANSTNNALEVIQRRHRRTRQWLVLAVVAAGAVGGGIYWKYFHAAPWPTGIVFSNGRLEAEEIDIDAKFAERVAQLLVDEGDLVAPGQVVALMDTRDVRASLDKAEAQLAEAQQALDEAKANAAVQKTQLTLAQQEFDRTNALVQRGFATYELLDQRQQALSGALASLEAANNRVGEAARTLDAAKSDVEFYKVNIADDTLVSPTIGRIQYRISNVGEVLPVGGKVFTMLDLSDVYMDIYLPTAEAGRARVGDEARILLDAYPKVAIPAHVSFIATQAQFTPKAVETKDERDKLMFRVKVRIDQKFLQSHISHARTGLPGIAYVRVDPTTEWPPELRHEAK